MLAIGVDIEEISRFENKDKKFLNRIFTKKELDYCLSKKYFAQHLCARFCAKEATIKALSTIGAKKPTFREIEILKKENGAPYINILVNEYKKYDFLISFSHEKNKAIAFVVIK